VFAFLAVFKQQPHKMERGIPNLSLEYASIACLVAGTREISNFLDDTYLIMTTLNSVTFINSFVDSVN